MESRAVFQAETQAKKFLLNWAPDDQPERNCNDCGDDGDERGDEGGCQHDEQRRKEVQNLKIVVSLRLT